MPIISNEVSVAANGLSTNVLSGELFEFLPSNAVVGLYATGAATGLRAAFSIGGVQLVEEAAVSAQNRTPIEPDDQLAIEGGVQGARLFLRFRNTTGAAIIARWMLKITPV